MISSKVANIIKNKTLLCCVSGGVDSMALLHYFISIKDEFNLNIFACHFEHGIRGNESIKDMELVKEYCKQNKIKLYIKQEKILENLKNENLEQYARERRYDFFYHTLNEINADYLVVAHHMDDNAETVLMNLTRGSGNLLGLYEIKDKVLRPFLNISKKDIREYANENNVPFNEDYTNEDTKYFRNLLRNDIIPKLQNKNKRFALSVKKTTNIFQDENDFFYKEVFSQNWIRKTYYGYDIHINEFSKKHIALKRKAIYFVLKELVKRNFNYDDIHNIIELCNFDTGKKIIVDRKIEVYKGYYNRLCFVVPSKKNFKSFELKLGENVTPFGKYLISTQDFDLEDIKSAKKNVAYVDSLDGLFVRSRKDGDRINLFSGKSKKLKDLFIDNKIDVFNRDKIGLICKDDDIVFIPNVARSNKLICEHHKIIKIEFVFA